MDAIQFPSLVQDAKINYLYIVLSTLLIALKIIIDLKFNFDKLYILIIALRCFISQVKNKLKSLVVFIEDNL